MGFGFGLSIGLSGGSTGISASFAISLTGLSAGEAQPGSSIGYTISPDNGTETVAWGTSSGDSTYGTGASPSNFTAGDGGRLFLTVTDNGETVSQSAPIRYAAGSAPSLSGQTWTVDDTDTTLDISASGANLTFSYAASSLPSGVTLSGNTLTIQPDAVASGTIGLTATDQYGRTLSYGLSYTASLRAQATAAGSLGPFSFFDDVAIASQNLAADFTANGNTLTYASQGAALPAVLAISSAGSLTGTPANVASLASFTVRATDEYGRTTDSAFNITIEEAPDFTLSVAADGQIEMNEATGQTTVTITSPAIYANYDAGNGAGVFTFTAEDADTGPVALVPVRIVDDGTPANGETLTVTPALWIYDGDNSAPAISDRWQRGGGDISGATSSSYQLVTADEGASITVIETATGTNGTRTSTSAAVTVAGSPAWTAPTPTAGDASVSLATGSNQPTAPSAPTPTAGDGEVTLDAA